MNSIVRTVALVVCVAPIFAAGCARNAPQQMALQAHHDDSGGAGVNGTAALDDFAANKSDIGQVKAVYFDYDSYALRSDALTALRGNASVFTGERRDSQIQVEGHCDERGTQEYNLALGEQRALAVRHHLMNLGVNGARITTISYGEERPADLGATEDSYALNRRCEFNVSAH